MSIAHGLTVDQAIIKGYEERHFECGKCDTVKTEPVVVDPLQLAKPPGPLADLDPLSEGHVLANAGIHARSMSKRKRSELRQSLSPDGSAGEGERRDRRQQVQSGQ